MTLPEPTVALLMRISIVTRLFAAVAALVPMALLANLMSKAALYGSLSCSGRMRGKRAARQKSSAFRIQTITIV